MLTAFIPVLESQHVQLCRLASREGAGTDLHWLPRAGGGGPVSILWESRGAASKGGTRPAPCTLAHKEIQGWHSAPMRREQGLADQARRLGLFQLRGEAEAGEGAQGQGGMG